MERERELVIECVEAGWISSEGTFVSRFEQMFADFLGVRHGIAVANGTAALELSLAALKLNPGDEVILPAFTIISCVLAVIRNGLRPVLVDVDRETWCMDIQKVREILGQRAKTKEHHGKIRAIMPVHIYGHPLDMDPLLGLAYRHGLYVIEDAAEVHGAEYFSNWERANSRMKRALSEEEQNDVSPEGQGSWQKCGAMGDIAAFSFYANKIITTGEGGMVVTSDDGLAERARSLRNLCFQTHQRFLHEDLGYNFRMTSLQAAVGVAQMERIDELIRRKMWQGQAYRKRLGRVEGIKLQSVKDWARPSYWVNGVVLDDDVPMDGIQFARKLRDRGVQTRPFFWPMHEQPIFAKMRLFTDECYPVSEKLARRGLYLPSGMALTELQINTVCDRVIDCLNGR